MSRLTEKNNRIVLISNYSQTPSKEKIAEANRYNKLAALEDLEEELGCPLEVLLKAISNGIYVKDLPSEDTIKQFGLRLSNIETEWYLSNNIMCVNIKGYKTLFWLKEDKSE